MYGPSCDYYHLTHTHGGGLMSDTKQALKEWLSYIPESQHGSIKQAIKQMMEVGK